MLENWVLKRNKRKTERTQNLKITFGHHLPQRKLLYIHLLKLPSYVLGEDPPIDSGPPKPTACQSWGKEAANLPTPWGGLVWLVVNHHPYGKPHCSHNNTPVTFKRSKMGDLLTCSLTFINLVRLQKNRLLKNLKRLPTMSPYFAEHPHHIISKRHPQVL